MSDYTYGKSRIRLLLCPACRCYRPAVHPCPGRPIHQEEADDD